MGGAWPTVPPWLRHWYDLTLPSPVYGPTVNRNVRRKKRDARGRHEDRVRCRSVVHVLSGTVSRVRSMIYGIEYRLTTERNRREEIVRTRVQNNIPYAFAQNRAISQSNSKSVDGFRRAEKIIELFIKRIRDAS